MNKLLHLAVILIAVPVCLSCARSFTGSYTGDGPSFCRGIDCPKFTVIDRTDEYELRSYEPALWVSTQIMNLDYQPAVSAGFEKLFEYISGHNAADKKIAMTAPVTARVIPGQGPTCESNFTVSFFVPFSLQASGPPQPNDPMVTVSHIPQHRAYVRSFGGFASQEDWIENAAKLTDSLNDTQTYDQSYYYTAGYDSPFTVFNRHNEIWFIAT